MNQLAIHQDDKDILLHQRNVLDEQIVDKYRTAGQITETGLKYIINLINDMYHYKTKELMTMQELCLISDSLLIGLLSKVYNKKEVEKTISMPTNFNVNEVMSNFSPELDDENSYYFKEGDVITINLGVQIDGYTSNVSHTICIYPPGEKPVGPLLGSKADSIIANYLATQIVTSLLGLSLTPEKIPNEIKQKFGSDKITGEIIRFFVDYIVEQFNCKVIPGSEVRQIRRFLSGQNELVQEKGYKGVMWTAHDQEVQVLKKLGVELNQESKQEEIIINPGEVYQINLKIASINEFNEEGLVVLDEVNELSGVNNKDEFNMKPTVFIRDFVVNYQLKLKSSKHLLNRIDKQCSVYPFKMNHLCENFPLQRIENNQDDINSIRSNLIENKLGLNELTNRNLINSKPIELVKFLPFKTILNKNLISIKDMDYTTLLKNESIIESKSIESTTICINNINNDIIKLTNSPVPSYCHSQFKINDPILDQLFQLLNDKRFGISVKSVSPMNIKNEEMQTD